jgi:hypothetical protein
MFAVLVRPLLWQLNEACGLITNAAGELSVQITKQILLDDHNVQNRYDKISRSNPIQSQVYFSIILPSLSYFVSQIVYGISSGQLLLGQVFSQYFSFLSPFLNHRLLLTRHPSFWAGIIGQIVADIPGGLNLTQYQENKITWLLIYFIYIYIYIYIYTCVWGGDNAL